MRGPRVRAFTLFALAAALLLVVGTAAASSGYTVESTTSIETPSRTVTVLGTDYTVTSLGYSDVGETLPVAVSRPGDGSFTVSLYNGDGDVMDSIERSENGTYTLEGTSSLERGTYVLALDVDGDTQTIQPVVLSGYDIAVDAPDTASGGDRVSVTIELTGDTERPDYVDVAVMNDSTHRYVATRVGDRTYNVVIGDLAPDEYRLYAAARSTEEVNGRDEMTGVSSVHRLDITSDGEGTATESPTATTGPAEDTETQSGATASPTGNVDTTATAPDAATTEMTDTPISTTVSTATASDTETERPTQQSGESTATVSDDNGASTPTDAPSDGTATATPMFPLNVLGAFIVLLLVVRRTAAF